MKGKGERGGLEIPREDVAEVGVLIRDQGRFEGGLRFAVVLEGGFFGHVFSGWVVGLI